MNRALLDELQQMRSYPSITILFNTQAGSTFGSDEKARVQRLAATARERLGKLVDDDPVPLIDVINALAEQRVGTRMGHAMALCVSAEHQGAVLLGGAVEERVIIDETFATRDLVADLNRTATYRVLTISDVTVRSFAGDRQRLAEERSDVWPLRRGDDISDTVWSQTVTAAVKALGDDYSVPTVTAGVRRSVQKTLDPSALDVIGHINGNYDRTSPGDLHTLVWPIIVDWKGQRQQRALGELEDARSAKRYAAGVDELWSLAEDGRVEHLVVEADFRLAARIDDNRHVHPTSDVGRDVIDDVVDEVIEVVLRSGGRSTMVEPETLQDCGRIAAVLRY
jgi:hypothetical protein